MCRRYNNNTLLGSQSSWRVRPHCWVWVHSKLPLWKSKGPSSACALPVQSVSQTFHPVCRIFRGCEVWGRNRNHWSLITINHRERTPCAAGGKVWRRVIIVAIKLRYNYRKLSSPVSGALPVPQLEIRGRNYWRYSKRCPKMPKDLLHSSLARVFPFPAACGFCGMDTPTGQCGKPANHILR